MTDKSQLERIGTIIAELRKKKGVKQDDVAKAVGVSAQAVSKWENGGTPDAELLPVIADYLGVSIDRLFGRMIADYSDIETEVRKYVAQPIDDAFDIYFNTDDVDEEKSCAVSAAAMERLRQVCWAANLGLFSTKLLEQMGTDPKMMIDALWNDNDAAMETLSKSISNSGIVLLSPMRAMPYFMLCLEPRDGWRDGLLSAKEYAEVFEALGDPNILNCLFFIHSKDEKKKFSREHFAKELELTNEHADEILERLDKMGYIQSSFIELDEEKRAYYSFKPNAAFVPLLIIAKTYAKPPAAQMQSTERAKPFFRPKEDKK